MMRKPCELGIVCLDDKAPALLWHLQGALRHHIELNFIATRINRIGSTDQPEALHCSLLGDVSFNVAFLP